MTSRSYGHASSVVSLRSMNQLSHTRTMAPSDFNAGTSGHEATPITVTNIASQLKAEKRFPAVKNLDLGLIKAWIRALDNGISNTRIKLLAPKVLEELFTWENVNARDVAIHQQHHPVKRVAPAVGDHWAERDALVQKPKHEPIKVEDLSPNLQAYLVEKNIIIKKGTRKTTRDNSSSKIKGDRITEIVDETTDNVSEAAAKELKKAKKAAKKARKLIKALEEALPPMGKMSLEDEDDGNDSDWSQSSWNPSWASDQEDSEEL